MYCDSNSTSIAPNGPSNNEPGLVQIIAPCGQTAPWSHPYSSQCGQPAPLVLTGYMVDYFTSHVGEHRTARGLCKFRDFPEFLKYPQCSSPRKRIRLLFTSHWWRLSRWRRQGIPHVYLDTSQLDWRISDALQPIRASFSETKEAVYRPMRGASRGVEQTRLHGGVLLSCESP